MDGRQSRVPPEGKPDRRTFLQLMGASLALAGAGGCTYEPAQGIVPYVHAPAEIVPGQSLQFASASLLNGYARGVVVRSCMGRPVKVEGNPRHPASLGATDAFMQAALLTVYDPARLQLVLKNGGPSFWGDFHKALLSNLPTDGAGLRILTGNVTSPSLAAQLKKVLEQYPQAHWHCFTPVPETNTRAGARQAFGRELVPLYDFTQAGVVVSLGGDFLDPGPAAVRHAHDFSARRRVRGTSGEMNRLYVAEGSVSLTGANAEHRLALRPSQVEPLAYKLAEALGVPNLSPLHAEPLPESAQQWLQAAAKDLKAHSGQSLLTTGEGQSPNVHTLVHAMNQKLQNAGRTVRYIQPVAEESEGGADGWRSLAELTAAMHSGEVKALLILGGNPAYDAPADIRFADALGKVALRAHLTQYANETTARCNWALPLAHELESWTDARAFDGTVTILQPMIAPLNGGRTPQEVLSALSPKDTQFSYELLRAFWSGQPQARADFETFWAQALTEGLVPGTAAAAQTVELQKDFHRPTPPEKTNADDLEIVFQPDHTVWDGNFSANAWLQELPKPLSRLTWDNALLLGPATAARLLVKTQSRVELRYRGRGVLAAVLVMETQPEGVGTLSLGYGRSEGAGPASGNGANANALRESRRPWHDSGLRVLRRMQSYSLARPQTQDTMSGRHPVLAGTLAQYRRDPQAILAPHRTGGPSLYPEWPYPGYRWGMVIDLTACIGCGACVMACQAENNNAVTGKEEVLRHRELHWLRVDRYFEHGSSGNAGEIYFQPVPCMHCEKAPCELVCPVNATVHSGEGLNDMVYNRCVGTRYCSNNCPYKVRRFNFFGYSKFAPSLQLLRNPDVTVRQRGVMEKCSYCVQRIARARIESGIENRRIRDGEVKTACQAACPTGAIVFGDLNDPESEVSRLRKLPLHYALLAELNTQPRTTYLARLRNPNEDLARTIHGMESAAQ